MMMIDIHSHDPQIKPGQIKVLSLQLHPDTDFTEVLNSIPSEILLSAGVHPWEASEWTSANISTLNTIAHSSRVAFIGEIGLDNACGVPLEKQLFVFEEQLLLAETYGKSVLIHSVGHQAELMALKKKFKHIPAWILHGFRGKVQMAEQYLKSDFYLSFGLNYQPEALRACPMDRLFLETDESDMNLGCLYQKVAEDLGLSVSALESFIARNFEIIRLK